MHLTQVKLKPQERFGSIQPILLTGFVIEHVSLIREGNPKDWEWLVSPEGLKCSVLVSKASSCPSPCPPYSNSVALTCSLSSWEESVLRSSRRSSLRR